VFVALDRPRVTGTVVVVDDTGAHGFNGGTLVRNDPLLTEGPKVMAIEALDDDQIVELCQHHSVAIFTGDDLALLGGDTVKLAPDPDVMRQRALLRQLRCGAPIG